jgi:DNA-binding NarL/FixJ family response regulator
MVEADERPRAGRGHHSEDEEGVRMIRVLVVDDHPLVEMGIGLALDQAGAPDIHVTARAHSVDEALAVLQHDCPGVVLCDVMLNDQPDGLRVVRESRLLPRPPAIVMLSSYDAPAFVAHARELGAAGYLLKSDPVIDILAAIRDAADGKRSFGREVIRALNAAQARPQGWDMQVIRLVAAGDSSGEIGAALDLSTRTVESRLRRMYLRHGLASRTELVTLAVKQGWLPELLASGETHE